MKPLLIFAATLFPLLLFGQKSYPVITIDSSKVIVTVTAKTSDEQLFQIRKNLLRFTSIRFVNFDVIRGKNGDIYFLSMHVDCRDGYVGNISHSFEQGDKSTWGFYRFYKKRTYQRPFFIGDMTSVLDQLFPDPRPESAETEQRDH